MVSSFAAFLVHHMTWCGIQNLCLNAANESTRPLPTRFAITGFNIEEFLNIEKVDRGVPIIVINGNLDRVRSG
jgi:hypothetical protein